MSARRAFAVTLLAAVAGGCAEPVRETVQAPAGEPVPGLAATEAARFATGKALFNRPFTPEEGLGPLFNQAQCSACHDLPTSGGHGAEVVGKATRWDAKLGCSLLAEGGGDLLQRSVTPAGRAAGLVPERAPPGTTDLTDIQPPALYGLGLVEAIPEADILAGADPDDADGDGISGRPGSAADGRLGRFGIKAVHATLSSFIEEATRGELGLTTPANPVETAPQGRPLPEHLDPAPDPEVDDAFLAAVVGYVTLLAPPTMAIPQDAEGRAAVAEGREVFTALGCADCHTPSWTTGPHPVEALNGRTFLAWSDFLLHDLGPENASICAPGASREEWRTTPLMGLSLRSVFLHDGRAQNLHVAIEAHGGEGAASRARYRALGPAARADLIRFLQSL